MAERTGRHARDAVSLVMGLFLMAVAGLFLVADLTDQGTDLRWTGPAVLIGIGALGLAASARRRPTHEDEPYDG
ncbi:MAG: hypothetical protein JWP11_3830 [Frankiales bacterium]|nr:hypothetical protein [Frankiales bacterium]